MIKADYTKEETEITNGYFKAAPMDTSAKITTLIVIGLAGAVPFFSNISVYVFILLPLVLLVTWLFSVTGYSISGNSLVVHRPLWKTEILVPAGAVASEEPEIAKGLWRTAGNGGLFGYTGGFRNKKLNNFKAFATNWNNAVSISFTAADIGLTVVVTPRDTQQFINNINGC